MAFRNTTLSGSLPTLQKMYGLFGRKGAIARDPEVLSHALFRNRLVGRIHKPADRLLHKYRHYRYPSKFTDADPYKIIFIPPEAIEYKLRLDDSDREVGHFDWWHDRNRVYDGPWDRQRTSFLDFHRSLYDCFEAHFLHDVPWSETAVVQQVLEKIENGNPTWHTSTSPQEVFARCDVLDRIWNSITTRGYCQQTAVSTAFDWRKDYSEVMVNIGRDGELLQNSEGKHRLIMARLAGIEEIPVRVIVRHREWQQLRNRIRNSETNDYPSHPDLEDISQTASNR